MKPRGMFSKTYRPSPAEQLILGSRRACRRSPDTSMIGSPTTPGMIIGDSGASAKHYGRVQVPALNFDGWYDVFLNGANRELRGHAQGRRVRRARAQAGSLVIGPYIHLPGTKGGRHRFRPRGRQSDRGSAGCVVRPLAERQGQWRGPPPAGPGFRDGADRGAKPTTGRFPEPVSRLLPALARRGELKRRQRPDQRRQACHRRAA